MLGAVEGSAFGELRMSRLGGFLLGRLGFRWASGLFLLGLGDLTGFPFI